MTKLGAIPLTLARELEARAPRDTGGTSNRDAKPAKLLRDSTLAARKP